MDMNHGDTVRFYVIRLVADPVRYEPRNIGILAWEMGAFQPMSRVDAPILRRQYHESGLWYDASPLEAAQSASRIEEYVLGRLEDAADSEAADRLIAETQLCLAVYPPLYVVERPGTLYISEKSFALNPCYRTLEGCIEHLMERMVLSNPR